MGGGREFFHLFAFVFMGRCGGWLVVGGLFLFCILFTLIFIAKYDESRFRRRVIGPIVPRNGTGVAVTNSNVINAEDSGKGIRFANNCTAKTKLCSKGTATAISTIPCSNCRLIDFAKKPINKGAGRFSKSSGCDFNIRSRS